METKEIKEIKIVPPEGYEIDYEKSTLEKIVFKKKDDKPRTWEEFCERGFTGKEAYVTLKGPAKSYCEKGEYMSPICVGYVDNLKEAEAFTALMQLRQLRKAWVGDWEPDWLSLNCKYVIESWKDCICISTNFLYSRCLSFPTKDMAEEFVKCFKDLLEQAMSLL